MEVFNFKIQTFVKHKFCTEDFKLLDHQKNRVTCDDKFKADSARHLVREAAGHDVHLQGDGVHEALPPGETIFICRTKTRRSTAAWLLTTLICVHDVLNVLIEPQRCRLHATVSSDDISINHTDEPSIMCKGAASSGQCVLAARRVDIILHISL